MKRTIEGDTRKHLEGIAKAQKRGDKEAARKHARRLRDDKLATDKDVKHGKD